MPQVTPDRLDIRPLRLLYKERATTRLLESQQLDCTLLSTAVHNTLPAGNYVRPESQRPRLAEVVVTGARIPVVDLACPDRASVVAFIADACRSHGFFQVLNHGIDAGLIAAVMAVARDFFRLPAAEKAKLYSDDPARKIRLSTSFDVRKETGHNWRDYLQLHDGLPLQQFVKSVRELGFKLCGAISDGLGLDATYIKQQTMGEPEQHVAVNLYPEPELTSDGLLAPTDTDALTIFFMDHHDVPGLQVLRGGGKWVAVNPHPGALVVSIGDQLLAKLSRELSIDAAVFQREPGALGLGQGVLDPDCIVPVHAFLCYSDGLVLPLESIGAAGETFTRSSPDATLVQVRVDEFVGAKATGEGDGRNHGRRGRRENILGILGIMAASLAVTASVPAAAGFIAPAMAFGSAVLMFTGVSMAMASIRGA